MASIDTSRAHPGHGDGHVTVDRTKYSAGYRSDWHHHCKAQLIYPSRGIMTIHTATRSWVVPPFRACWVPALEAHRVESSKLLEMHSVYCGQDVRRAQQNQSAIIPVSGLLRELIFAMGEAGRAARTDASTERLGQVLLDQMNLARGPHSWSRPVLTGAISEIGTALVADPADPRTLQQWSVRIGRTARTLSREFLRQTGTTFTNYRQQIRLQAAFRQLSAGASVTAVAYELGFSSASAFVDAFRNATGITPGRYVRSQVRR